MSAALRQTAATPAASDAAAAPSRPDDIPASGPAFRDDAFDRVVVTRAAEVAAVLADKTLSNDFFKARPTALAGMGLRPEDRGFQTLAQADGEEHARLRRLITQALSARAIAAMRPTIEATANTLLDAIDPDEPFELVSAFASPLPMLIIAAMLGIDDADVGSFRVWSNDLMLMLKPNKSPDELARMVTAITELDTRTAEQVANRRAAPRDDLIGALVSAGEGGDRLTTDEIVNNTRLLLSAGNVTTTDLISSGVVLLLTHPSALSDLDADPSLWPSAIEEILRIDPPLSFMMRQALDDRKIGTCPVEAGQTVTAMLASANRDPDLHADPDAFDIHRKDRRHFSFGGGAHLCPGAALARLELAVALPALFARFPKLHLTPGRPSERKAHPMFNGHANVWVSPA